MKIYQKNIKDTKYTDILEFFPHHGKAPLYIDIETTGFRRDKDMVYLVGLIEVVDDELMLTQFLCEKTFDEYELLYKLNQLLPNYDTLIHFNGDSFDLPFLKERMKLYNIQELISGLDSFDYYKYLRPMKRFIGTDDLKLKTLEKYAGYERIDPFTGGELIQLFRQYLKGDSRLEYNFILHNEEDMIGLYYLNLFLPMIYVFHDCMVIGFSESSVEEYKDANGNTKAVDINYSLKLAKVRISTMEFANEVVSVKLDESGLTVSFTIEELELKTYFENYREYYYLPEEDCAVHESVAGFMSNRHRKKATAKTAYIKRKDAFIRCPMSAKNLKGILPGNHLRIYSDRNSTIRSATFVLKISTDSARSSCLHSYTIAYSDPYSTTEILTISWVPGYSGDSISPSFL